MSEPALFETGLCVITAEETPMYVGGAYDSLPRGRVFTAVGETTLVGFDPPITRQCIIILYGEHLVTIPETVGMLIPDIEADGSLYFLDGHDDHGIKLLRLGSPTSLSTSVYVDTEKFLRDLEFASVDALVRWASHMETTNQPMFFFQINGSWVYEDY